MKNTLVLSAEDVRAANLNARRRLRRLRADVQDARSSWEAFFKANASEEEVLWGDVMGAGGRTLYLLRPQSAHVADAVSMFQKELEKLARRISRMPELSKGDRQALWLPEVLRNADKILVKTYHSSSASDADLPVAEKMLRKLGKQMPPTEGRFVITRPPVIDRSLQCVSGGELQTVRMNVPLWAVCILNNKPFPEILYRTDSGKHRRVAGTAKQTASITEGKLRQRKCLQGERVDVLAEDNLTMVFFEADSDDLIVASRQRALRKKGRARK